jgi:hypothetical protein
MSEEAHIISMPNEDDSCPNPFVLSLSKHCPFFSAFYQKEKQPFDKLRANGGGGEPLSFDIMAQFA